MRRLRITFKRSRTPTGAEMKTQNSLEVPRQVRSASFDEMQLEGKRDQESNEQSEDKLFLKVPASNQRSKSMDATTSEDRSTLYLEVPRPNARRRSSSDKMAVYCIHCQYVVDIEKFHRSILVEDECIDSTASLESLSSLLEGSDVYSTGEEDKEETEAEEESRWERELSPMQECNIRITRCPNSSSSTSADNISEELFTNDTDPSQNEATRRSVASPKLPRQSAFVIIEKDSYSQKMFNEESDVDLSKRAPTLDVSEIELDLKIEKPCEPSRPGGSERNVLESSCVRSIFLQVPELKRDRAASVDSCFNKVSQVKAEEVCTNLLEPPPNVTLRSRSVDIVLPTDEQSRYKALAMAHTTKTTVPEKVALGNAPDASDASEKKLFASRTTPDWSEAALNGDHLWSPVSASGDTCYVEENDCTKHGARLKCSACKIIVHTSCIPALNCRTKFYCKPTFRDVGVRQYREQTSVFHHWVHKRSQKGKCESCSKSFQSKLSFTSKEIIAIVCSWCKTAYHNRETCFNMQKINEQCDLGRHCEIIVPPSWIVKLPQRGSFTSSLRRPPKKKQSSKKKSRDKAEKEGQAFVIKPIPSASLKPVIVFINPRSGGNQGFKLLQKFQWLLNPRQVFDLSKDGPKLGLEMFKKVINLRILACGGDGTVGWILSMLDQMQFTTPPPVGVLPLGTGNDLARALGWGAGYTDEPLGKILSNIAASEKMLLDRWELKIEKNPDVEAPDDGEENLPLNVLNNYFSLGVDAHIALEFHEAREAHPERFNSRLRNKMFYGQMGGKDLLKRKWKDLSDFVHLECDDEDFTPKLKEHKVHAIVFLNIPFYGGGTRPWNRTAGAADPAMDDGLIEVIGLTTYQLPLLQAGGHGTCITQCKKAKIVTRKTIPMQVDGEACRVKPSVIHLSLLNKAPMLVKRKRGQSVFPPATLEQIKVSVQKIGMSDYEQHHYDKDLLAQAATEIGTLEVSLGTDLEQIRNLINQMMEETGETKISPDWCFIDSCTAERFFRVDRAQENLHYITDVASETLFILDPEKCVNASEEDLQTSDTVSPPSITAPDFSVSSPENSDEGKKGHEEKPEYETIYERKPTEEVSLKNKFPETEYRLEQKPRINQSPSAGAASSTTLEKNNDNIIEAAKSGDLKLLKDLHSEGFSLLSIDSTGQTALHHSARCGHKDIVKYLITCAPCAIINMIENVRGRTALHIAAANKRRSICGMLIAGGATVSQKDYGGQTPRQLALDTNDPDLAAYLESQEQFQLSADEVEETP